MKNRYIMTREENVLLGNRDMVNIIFSIANLSNIDITYVETSLICEGISCRNLKIKDINAVFKLKEAWEFILKSPNLLVDYNYISNINKIVGANFTLSVPDEVKFKKDLADLLSIRESTERAVTLMLFLMRSQIFYDGNKRTAMIAANQIMISNGCGIITIPIEEQGFFRNQLIKFYETGDMEVLKEFIYNKCIYGIKFQVKENKDLIEFEEKLKSMKKRNEN